MRYAVILKDMMREDAAAICRVNYATMAIDHVGNFLALCDDPQQAQQLEIYVESGQAIHDANNR